MAAQWEKLFLLACDLIDQVNREHQIIDEWTFGGGTALMLQIGHRDSDDIDIFLDDHQLLPYLDPARQNFDFSMAPSDYSGDGTGFLKMVFDGVGEIDFIVCTHVTEQPALRVVLEGRQVMLETVAEIITKKIFYRGSRIAPRDIFDIAAASPSHRNEIVSALAEHRQKVELALAQISRSDTQFIIDVIAELRIRPAFRHMAGNAVEVASEILREALARSTPASET
ncbi:nucleotidyl transferase AbiEii/AbiGii toxin family protein [Rhizobium sp. LjRoot254]|uniref:nucleotidyl transferase AbiEii/AbiGii toxin family protein n=1 Tax=Rhizobium sp. LjRoot254 TaxID=3342297 RepID=UPI003ED0F477